jgi:hypothetical protein
MAPAAIRITLLAMKPPQEPGSLPLDYAAEIAFELHLLRAECSQAARHLMSQCPLDEHALEECARLDEALARAHAVVQTTIARIRCVRAKRRPRSR